MGKIDQASECIESLKQGSLGIQIAQIEQGLVQADGKTCDLFLASRGILPNLLESALEIKRVSSQIR